VDRTGRGGGVARRAARFGAGTVRAGGGFACRLARVLATSSKLSAGTCLPARSQVLHHAQAVEGKAWPGGVVRHGGWWHAHGSNVPAHAVAGWLVEEFNGHRLPAAGPELPARPGRSPERRVMSLNLDLTPHPVRPDTKRWYPAKNNFVAVLEDLATLVTDQGVVTGDEYARLVRLRIRQTSRQRYGRWS
jgi:hypothetical protein